MIYADNQLKEKILKLMDTFENEVIEFKEARLVFGISDEKEIVGTEFRKQGGLHSLKKEIVNGTNERLTFMEIYEWMSNYCISDPSSNTGNTDHMARSGICKRT